MHVQCLVNLYSSLAMMVILYIYDLSLGSRGLVSGEMFKCCHEAVFPCKVGKYVKKVKTVFLIDSKYHFINFCSNVAFVMLYQLHVSWQNANIPEQWYNIVFVLLQQLHASCQN
jgi:hypothetical protein